MQRPLGLPGFALSRRRWLRVALAALAAPCAAARADSRDAARSSHFPFGPVVPARPLPPRAVTTDRGVATDLGVLLRGRVSALQLMFTGCSATCPIQGALFAQAQRELPGAPNGGMQLLSLSIDPLGDTPAALAAWLRQFGAGPAWRAALPRMADVDGLVEWLGRGGEKKPQGPDPHTGQVYIVNRRGELVYRTPAMPTPAQIVAALREVAALP